MTSSLIITIIENVFIHIVIYTNAGSGEKFGDKVGTYKSIPRYLKQNLYETTIFPLINYHHGLSSPMLHGSTWVIAI